MNQTETKNMKSQFKTGATYGVRSICDHNCIFEFIVHRRTEKSIWIEDLSHIRRGIYRCKIKNRDVYGNPKLSEETCSPLGVYSMSPTLVATQR